MQNKLLLACLIKVDTTRIVVSGMSAGGQAAWNFAQLFAHLVAAALPISAASLGNGKPPVLDIPIWLFQGGLDTDPHPPTAQVVVNY